MFKLNGVQMRKRTILMLGVIIALFIYAGQFSSIIQKVRLEGNFDKIRFIRIEYSPSKDVKTPPKNFRKFSINIV